VQYWCISKPYNVLHEVHKVHNIAHLPQQCHNSKSVIFPEKRLKVLKCYNFVRVQRRHNCSPAASFANCVMTLYLLKEHLQTFLSIPITQKCQILSCDTLVANYICILQRIQQRGLKCIQNFIIIHFNPHYFIFRKIHDYVFYIVYITHFKSRNLRPILQLYNCFLIKFHFNKTIKTHEFPKFYFVKKTLHVSGIFFDHHQEFSTSHSTLVYSYFLQI
jgi:hypothetical protein